MPEQSRVNNVVNGDVTGTVVQAGDVVIARVRPRPPPRQLPASPSRFVGRTCDLAGLASSPGVHAIVGIGGIGKTWLAVHWAHVNRHRFPDGQLFVDLRGFSPDQPMVPAVAVRGFLDALGAVDIPPDPHAQVALYRSLTADKRLLVVLDNAADAAQVESLLPGGSSCTVLVTSRHQLTSLITRHGTLHLRLGLLDDAECHDLLVARLGSGSKGTVHPAPGMVADQGRIVLQVVHTGPPAVCHTRCGEDVRPRVARRAPASDTARAGVSKPGKRPAAHVAGVGW